MEKITLEALKSKVLADVTTLSEKEKISCFGNFEKACELISNNKLDYEIEINADCKAGYVVVTIEKHFNITFSYDDFNNHTKMFMVKCNMYTVVSALQHQLLHFQ